ncbi:MarR family transcriptional regulator [Sphingomonas sp.]|uniref:MarR family transcriptional regulator n=1 Tax=Sphingomonas sp. TaxID=28214 RepID=UPI001B270538|nr:MarR family transcriptional regulator [Sphingomonas sp.]MBO9715168.1 hypothetical protein [Sphingomonas sp.]
MHRLLKITSAVAEQRSCTPADAIAHIECAMFPAEAPSPGLRPLHEFAEGLRRARARRCGLFGTLRFRDPVWDMLLDLYVARARGLRLSVGALCVGSGVPGTTALRHIEGLDKLGYVRRQPDARDNRRIWIELTDETIAPMETVLSQMQRSA